MAPGLQPARHVDRQLAVALDPAPVDRPLALARRGEAHRLVLDQLGRVKQSWLSTKGEIEQVETRCRQRLLPGELRAFKTG